MDFGGIESHQYKKRKPIERRRIIIDNIIEELDKKRDMARNKKQKTLLKDEVLKYGEEDTIDYILFRIRELTGNNCIKNKNKIGVLLLYKCTAYPYQHKRANNCSNKDSIC